MQQYQLKFKGVVSLFFILLGSSGLLGCSISPTQAPSNSIMTTTSLPSLVNSQLAGVDVGQHIEFAESPWGVNVRLDIEERFFAASGRLCLRGKVNQQLVLLCQQHGHRWVVQRHLASANDAAS